VSLKCVKSRGDLAADTLAANRESENPSFFLKVASKCMIYNIFEFKTIRRKNIIPQISAQLDIVKNIYFHLFFHRFWNRTSPTIQDESKNVFGFYILIVLVAPAQKTLAEVILALFYQGQHYLQIRFLRYN
jgi:hypothetical protein